MPGLLPDIDPDGLLNSPLSPTGPELGPFRAIANAPATFIAVDPPRYNPSYFIKSKINGRASSIGQLKAMSTGALGKISLFR